MKSHQILTLIIIICLFSNSWGRELQGKKEGILIVNNNFFSTVEVNVYRNDSDDNWNRATMVYPKAETKQVEESKLSFGDSSREIRIKKIKNASYLWVRLYFPDNGAQWESEMFIMAPGSKKTLEISLDPVNSNFDNCNDSFVNFALLDRSGKIQKTYEDGIPVVNPGDCQFKNLKKELYQSITVFERDVDNEKNLIESRIDNDAHKERIWDLLGGLALIRKDQVSNEITRINYISANTLKKELDIQSIRTFKGSKNGRIKPNYEFEGYYLKKLIADWNNYLPGFNRYDIETINESSLYTLDYVFENHQNISNLKVSEDVESLESMWSNLPDRINNAFLEEFIHTKNSSSRSDYELVEVWQYNTAVTYESMNLKIDEYNPSEIKEKIDYVTKEGPFSLKETDVHHFNGSNRILAIGIDSLSKERTREIGLMAKQHLKNMKDKSGTTSKSERFSSLKSLNFQAYPILERYGDYREILEVMIEKFESDYPDY